MCVCICVCVAGIDDDKTSLPGCDLRLVGKQKSSYVLSYSAVVGSTIGSSIIVPSYYSISSFCLTLVL